jgi:hypothetical protein
MTSYIYQIGVVDQEQSVFDIFADAEYVPLMG